VSALLPDSASLADEADGGPAAGADGGARQARYAGVRVVASQSEARRVIAGDAAWLVVVERGRPRSVVFRCPCGCGEDLVVNVDREAGEAWRLRLNDGWLTLMPSVWRTSGCRSHFILWSNTVWWCMYGEDDVEPEWPEAMEAELKAEWRRIRAARRAAAERDRGASAGL
jgi:hypothetical protein